MSALTEVPGVNTAVEHLEELADRMRSDFGFAEHDVINIDKVIEALRELEAERSKAHDRLETETIKASIHRHKLQFLPETIAREIKDAVESARRSNVDALAFLKNQLEKINENCVYLEGYQKKLDEENAVLHPERELIRQQHEEIISQLNQRMAEKASMQIKLNETRDKVRQTNQDIVDLEDGILQLKEDLIHERTEARQEKRQLKKAIASTTDKTKEQKQFNVDKKKELDSIHEKLMDSEGKLDALRKSLRRYETSKAKLEGQERALNAQLQKQLKQNEDLRRKGSSIISEDLKLQKEFTDNEKQLIQKLKRLENEIESETSRFDELDVKKTELTYELDEKLEVRAQDAERVASLDEQLQNEKRNLNSKAEEMGRMQKENEEMTEQIEQLHESHKAIETQIRHHRSIRTPSPPKLSEEEQAALDQMEEEERQAVLAQLNKQIEDYREQLSKERQERLEVQERKNSVSKELEDYKIENQRFMQEMNNKITTGKSQHIELTNEQNALEEQIKVKQELVDLGIIEDDLPLIDEESEPESSSSSTSLEDDEVLYSTRGRPTHVGAQLQKELREDESEIKDLEDQLEMEQKHYQEVFTQLQNKVEDTEKEIIEMEHGIAEKTQTIEDSTPAFQELEKNYDARNAAYDKQKKDIVELKTKKTALEDQIKKCQDQKDKMTDPQEQLRQDLKRKRHEVLFQLKHHGEQTQKIESEIYVGGCKLRTVMEENQRFANSISQLQKDIDDIQQQMEDNEKLKMTLTEELYNTKGELENSWHEDQTILEHFTERDQEVVTELGNLLDRTGKREQKISEISSQLEVELGYLSDFLDNLASRRPKDSYLSQCKTPMSDSPAGSRPLSQLSRLSRASGRSRTPLDAVAAANLAENLRVPPSPSSRPQTSKSGRSVVITEDVTELKPKSRILRKSDKL